jgi:hypothetical protein
VVQVALFNGTPQVSSVTDGGDTFVLEYLVQLNFVAVDIISHQVNIHHTKSLVSC